MSPPLDFRDGISLMSPLINSDIQLSPSSLDSLNEIIGRVFQEFAASSTGLGSTQVQTSVSDVEDIAKKLLPDDLFTHAAFQASKNLTLFSKGLLMFDVPQVKNFAAAGPGEKTPRITSNTEELQAGVSTESPKKTAATSEIVAAIRAPAKKVPTPKKNENTPPGAKGAVPRNQFIEKSNTGKISSMLPQGTTPRAPKKSSIKKSKKSNSDSRVKRHITAERKLVVPTTRKTANKKASTAQMAPMKSAKNGKFVSGGKPKSLSGMKAAKMAPKNRPKPKSVSRKRIVKKVKSVKKFPAKKKVRKLSRAKSKKSNSIAKAARKSSTRKPSKTKVSRKARAVPRGKVRSAVREKSEPKVANRKRLSKVSSEPVKSAPTVSPIADMAKTPSEVSPIAAEVKTLREVSLRKTRSAFKLPPVSAKRKAAFDNVAIKKRSISPVPKKQRLSAKEVAKAGPTADSVDFSQGINLLLPLMHADFSFDPKALKLVNNFLLLVLDRLADITCDLSRRTMSQDVVNEECVSSVHSHAAVMLLLPADLSQHAAYEGSKATFKAALVR